MLCLQDLDAFRAFLSGPASFLRTGGGRSHKAPSLLLVTASVVHGNAEARPVPVSKKHCPALFPLALHAAPRPCPFHAATLQTLRGSLRGRGEEGEMILKTKYLQQQKPLGSPDLCAVIYVGEGGGLRRGNQQCTTSLSFVL